MPVVVGPHLHAEAALFCSWCSRACDDLLLVRLNGKENRLCPGCVADRRTKGDDVVVRGVL